MATMLMGYRSDWLTGYRHQWAQCLLCPTWFDGEDSTSHLMKHRERQHQK